MASRNAEKVCDHRQLVQKYLQQKLAKSGHAWEFEDEDEEEEDEDEEEEEDGHGDGGDWDEQKSAAVLGALLAAGAELQRLYRAEVNALAERLAPEPGQERRSFAAVAEEMFRGGVNWGRIVALLEFGAAVSAQRGRHAAVSRCITRALNASKVRHWIRDNGGWDAFVDLYGRQKESVLSSSWPSIMTVFSLAALGAVGFTIGAYLAQK
ncbi:apoptosis regulator Bcl-2-like [Hoplias malabaricus]|uniref:apoptosis regulator Bcl-2-like n=1 Tax=Hoplias malabaricus TaxID=27720 RepID=UPI003462ABA2